MALPGQWAQPCLNVVSNNGIVLKYDEMSALFHTTTPQRQVRQRAADRAWRIIDCSPRNNLTAYHVEYVALRTVNCFEVVKIYSASTTAVSERHLVKSGTGRTSCNAPRHPTLLISGAQTRPALPAPYACPL